MLLHLWPEAPQLPKGCLILQQSSADLQCNNSPQTLSETAALIANSVCCSHLIHYFSKKKFIKVNQEAWKYIFTETAMLKKALCLKQFWFLGLSKEWTQLWRIFREDGSEIKPTNVLDTETQNSWITTTRSAKTWSRSLTPTSDWETGKYSDSCKISFGVIPTQRSKCCIAFRSIPAEWRPARNYMLVISKRS